MEDTLPRANTRVDIKYEDEEGAGRSTTHSFDPNFILIEM